MSDDTIETGRARAGDRWPTAEEAFAEGLRIRREMWGAGATDAQIEATTSFSWPLQDTVTRWCFGETWSRDELDPATRSMLTLGVLMAIGQFEQVKVHTRSAPGSGSIRR